MNRTNPSLAPKQTTAYAAAQNALGCPVVESLQVDESLDSMREVVEFHMETVRALLRRLEPATGELEAGIDPCAGGFSKVALALRIDCNRDQICRLTAEVQTAIRQLQI